MSNIKEYNVYKDEYMFVALFKKLEEDNNVVYYDVDFPDIPEIITYGDDLKMALDCAKEALELHLWNLEDEGEEIPNETDIEDIEKKEGCFVIPIVADMKSIRKKMKNASVRKNLTIPQWLSEACEKENINFSSVLQDALKDKLGIDAPN